MSAGLISLLAGVLIGLVYALLKVRSPAPPALALVGLLGMLAGEQLTSEMLQPAQANVAVQPCPAPPDATSSLNHACKVKG